MGSGRLRTTEHTSVRLLSADREEKMQRSMKFINGGRKMRKLIYADALIDRLEFCIKEGMGSTITYTFMHMVDEAPGIATKQVKYYDEDEQVWKIGNVIVE